MTKDAVPGRRPRLFVGVQEIAGYYCGIVDELRKMGYRITFAGSAHSFAYGSTDAALGLARWHDRCLASFAATRRSGRIVNLLWFLLLRVSRVALLCVTAVTCDLFIFSFGRSFFPGGHDLWLLKALGKRVIVNVGHGSEARPPYLDGALFDRGGNWPLAARLHRRTARMVRHLRRIERYATVMVGAPLTSQFLNGTLINWFALGLPDRAQLCAAPVTKPAGRSGVIRIVHAPSHPICKGSNEIRAMVQDLRAEGLDIDLIELVGRPNQDVLDELAACDFVIDQLYSDTPMAGLAMEAAAFGKPSVVGGYGFDVLRPLVPADMWPPSAICHPAQLKETVRRLAEDADYRLRLGEEARRFVAEKWGRNTAARWATLIEGRAPDDWFYDPASVCYTFGCGIERHVLARSLGAYLKLFGRKGLFLEHRPDIERAIIDLATKSEAGAEC